MSNRVRYCAKYLALVMVLGSYVLAGAKEPAELPLVLKQNGGWCWFQGERAVVVNHQVVFTSIAGDDGAGWDAGDLVVTMYDLATQRTSHFELHDRLQRDDHDAAGLLVLPNHRLLAVYGKHGNDNLQRWRITQRPAAIDSWTDERTLDVRSGYTYSNLFRLEAERGRIYNFHRGLGFNPNCTISDDEGQTWRYGWRLFEWTREDLIGDPRFTGMDGRRPYLRYASNGRDVIHFITTDDHPRAYDNSIYHGYYRDGKLFRSDGTVAGTPGTDGRSPLKPRDFTELFPGGPDRVAWTTDMRLDANGHPYVAFSVQRDGQATRTLRHGDGGQDHRYHYARWDGKRWHVQQMAYAGTRLYAGEDDYTGLAALDPHDPNIVFISTNADPRTGEPLISQVDGRRHWEIFQGQATMSNGETEWSWTPITRHSTQDNLRPLIPFYAGGPRLVLWARGELKSFTDYRLDIVLLRQSRGTEQP